MSLQPSSEFLFRLPAASAVPSSYTSVDGDGLDAVPVSCVTTGLFTTSSWRVLQQMANFSSDQDSGLAQSGRVGHDYVGTLEDIVTWVSRHRPRHWSAAIRSPEAAGGLLHLHRLRLMCDELLLGGVVDDAGKWCLTVSGTSIVDGDMGDLGGRVGEAEYLCIAVAEATTMLVQLYTERAWRG
jgi:hypothetical protein